MNNVQEAQYGTSEMGIASRITGRGGSALVSPALTGFTAGEEDSAVLGRRAKRVVAGGAVHTLTAKGGGGEQCNAGGHAAPVATGLATLAGHARGAVLGAAQNGLGATVG